MNIRPGTSLMPRTWRGTPNSSRIGSSNHPKSGAYPVVHGTAEMPSAARSSSDYLGRPVGRPGSIVFGDVDGGPLREGIDERTETRAEERVRELQGLCEVRRKLDVFAAGAGEPADTANPLDGHLPQSFAGSIGRARPPMGRSQPLVRLLFRWL